jgi:hypothetical protein
MTSALNAAIIALLFSAGAIAGVPTGATPLREAARSLSLASTAPRGSDANLTHAQLKASFIRHHGFWDVCAFLYVSQLSRKQKFERAARMRQLCSHRTTSLSSRLCLLTRCA